VSGDIDAHVAVLARLRDQLLDLLLDGGAGAAAVAVRREIYERRAIHQDYLNFRHAAQQAGQWAGRAVVRLGTAGS
jgi:hypothetical protein